MAAFYVVNVRCPQIGKSRDFVKGISELFAEIKRQFSDLGPEFFRIGCRNVFGRIGLDECDKIQQKSRMNAAGFSAFDIVNNLIVRSQHGGTVKNAYLPVDAQIMDKFAQNFCLPAFSFVRKTVRVVKMQDAFGQNSFLFFIITGKEGRPETLALPCQNMAPLIKGHLRPYMEIYNRR